MRKAIATLAVLFPLIAAGANVANVDFATGNVIAVGTDGRSRPLTRGSEIEVGETVNTQEGRAQLRFADGAYMSLQPGTEFKIEQFHYDGKADGKENIVMNLLKGGMRTVTGLIGRANRQNYKLRTEVATIGIRGTEYSVQYTNSIEVFCAGGSISVENEAGTLVLNSGEGASVQNVQAAPRRTEERPFLPPQSGGGQQDAQDKPAEPDNPTQEANPPVTEETVKGLTPPVAPTLLTGTMSLNMAFANHDDCGDNCIDINVKLGNTGTLDASGRLVAFVDPQSPGDVGETRLGQASVADSGNDGVIAWGRWTNGQLEGDGSNAYRALSDTDSLYYVVGLPVTNMPTTGSGSYNMIGSSASCAGNDCTGLTVNSSKISVDFASGSVGLEMILTLAGGGNAGVFTYTQSSASALNRANGAIDSSGTLSGGQQTGLLDAKGFLAGDGASRAGLAFRGSIGVSVGATSINGIAAYAK